MTDPAAKLLGGLWKNGSAIERSSIPPGEFLLLVHKILV